MQQADNRLTSECASSFDRQSTCVASSAKRSGKRPLWLMTRIMRIKVLLVRIRSRFSAHLDRLIGMVSGW